MKASALWIIIDCLLAVFWSAIFKMFIPNYYDIAMSITVTTLIIISLIFISKGCTNG
jgi:hypothetical protein